MTYREYDNTFLTASMIPCALNPFCVLNQQNNVGEGDYTTMSIEDPSAPRTLTSIVGNATLIHECTFTGTAGCIDSVLRYDDYIYTRHREDGDSMQLQLIEYQISTSSSIVAQVPYETADYYNEKSKYIIVGPRKVLSWTECLNLSPTEYLDQNFYLIDYSSGTAVVTKELTIVHYGSGSPPYAYSNPWFLTTLLDENNNFHAIIFGVDDHNLSTYDDLYPYVYHKNFTSNTAWEKHSTQWTGVYHSPSPAYEETRFFNYAQTTNISQRYCVAHFASLNTTNTELDPREVVFDITSDTLAGYVNTSANYYQDRTIASENNGKAYISCYPNDYVHNLMIWSFDPATGTYNKEYEETSWGSEEELFPLSTREQAYYYANGDSALFDSLGNSVSFSLPYDSSGQLISSLIDDSGIIWYWDALDNKIKGKNLVGALVSETTLSGFTPMDYISVHHFGDRLIVTNWGVFGAYLTNHSSKVYMVT